MVADRLVLVAERHNPRRAFLLVSTVLGKHLPVDGARCRLAGLALGLQVAADDRAQQALATALDGTEAQARELVDAIEAAPPGAGEPYLVVGFAETATALGEQVASALDATWWQTTTRQASVAASGVRFDEPHSHAPDQWIARPPGGWADGTLVLVDDELTTGSTACNLIEVLQAEHPRDRYVIAALLDGRGSHDSGDGPIAETARRLGVQIDVVALAGRGDEPRTEAGWSGGTLPEQRPVPAAPAGVIRELQLGFDGPLQHDGQGRDARLALAAAASRAAEQLGPLPAGTLMLGTGEHLAFAQRVAVASGALTSSSTRSPVLVGTLEGYPIRDGLAFPNPDDLTVPGFAYNVRAAERPAIVVHFQDAAHRERGQAFLDLLVADGARTVIAVTLAA